MQGNRERGCFGLATGAFAKDARKGCRRGSLAHQKCSEGRKRREGTRGWKAQEAGRHEARVTGGRLAQICARNAFRRTRGLWGSLRLWGSLKLFLEGALGLGGLYGSFWGLWGSAGFVRAQGGIALRFPFPFTDLL